MQLWNWINDNILDKDNLKRTQRNIRVASRQKDRAIREARARGTSSEELKGLEDEWFTELVMLSDDYLEALTNQIIQEARRRHIPVPQGNPVQESGTGLGRVGGTLPT